ncbi:MAG: prealbumin-like fold domain-containing protein [Actinomycetaceae bacterium]|nr:prealbumin-like fold domain-containing protein [Actinomycetaceae bacterium]
MRYYELSVVTRRYIGILIAFLSLSLFMPAVSASNGAYADSLPGSHEISIRAIEFKEAGQPGADVEKAEFLSGEPFNLKINFSASFEAFPQNGFRLRLLIPKSEYQDGVPRVGDSSHETRIVSDFNSDPNNYIVDFYYENPQAINVTTLVGMKYKNDVTPDGTSLSASLVLSNGSGSATYLTDQTTITIHSKKSLSAFKGARLRIYSGLPDFNDERVTLPSGENVIQRKDRVYNPTLHGKVSDGRVVYQLGVKHNYDSVTNPNAYGRFIPKKIRLIDHVPAGAKVEETGGWKKVDGSENSYYYDIEDMHSFENLRNILNGAQTTLTVDYGGLPAGKQVIAETDPKYVNRLEAFEIIESPDGSVRYEKIGEDTETHMFYTEYFKPSGEVRLSLIKTIVGQPFFIGDKLYFLKEGEGGSKTHTLVDLQKPDSGFVWSLNAYKSDRGELAQVPTYFRNIDDSIPYYMRVTGVRIEPQYGAEEGEKQKVRDLIAGAGMRVYVGKSAHHYAPVEYTLIAENVQPGQFVPIDDLARNYNHVKVEATRPIPFVNGEGLDLFVYTHLTDETFNKLAKFPRDLDSYSVPESVHENTADLNYSPADLGTITSTRSSAKVQIKKLFLYEDTFASVLGNTGSLIYQNCELRDIPKPYKTSSCSRVGEMRITAHVQKTLNDRINTPDMRLKNPRFVTLLPRGFEFIEYTNRAQHSLYPGGIDPKTLQTEIIHDYKGSGKTAVITHFPDLYLKDLYEQGAQFYADMSVDATLAAQVGENYVEVFTIWDNMEGIASWAYASYPLNNSTNTLDIYDVDEDGNYNEPVQVDRVKFTVTHPRAVIARKFVAAADAGLDGSSIPEKRWLVHSNGIDADSNASVYYKLQVANGLDVPSSKFTIIDVLPHSNDHNIVPTNGGAYLPRVWTGQQSDGTFISGDHSAFETPLKGGVGKIVQTVGDTKIDVTNQYDVFYTFTEQQGTIQEQKNVAWVPANQVAGVGQMQSVKAFKVVLKDGYSIPANAMLEIFTENTVKLPTDKANAVDGSRSVNTYAMSIDGETSFQEANPVTTEFVKYKVRGIAFEDKVKDGLFNDSEDTRTDGITAVLINAETGQIVTQDGVPVQAQISKNGEFGYSFDVYKRGKYRVGFLKPNKQQIFTILPKLSFSPYANHVAVCSADNNFDAASDTAQNCAETNAENVLSGWTEEFVLDPAHRLQERNVGVLPSLAKTFQVAWDKTDTQSRLLGGSEWKITGNNNGIVTDIKVTDCVSDPCGDLLDKNPTPGKFLVENLPAGAYELTETVAPLGYVKSNQPFNRTIETTQSPSAPADWGHIENQLQTVPQIPLTGGLGEDIFLIIGALTILAGLLGVTYNARKTQ